MPIPIGTAPYVSTPNAKERAVQIISQWIIEGTLGAGEKIRDVEIAHALGVSRMPVREALQTLEAIGFIETEPNRGTHVSVPVPNDIYPLYKTIARLECLGLEDAMNPIRTETIEELYMLNHRFHAALDRSEVMAMLGIDRDFHQRLVSSDANRFSQQALAPLKKVAARYEYRYFSSLQSFGQDSLNEHRLILEALVQQDIMRAQEILTQNWLRTATVLQAWYTALPCQNTVSPDSTTHHE